MKWILIAVGLVNVGPIPVATTVIVERMESLDECFYTGERLKAQFERTWDQNLMSFSCDLSAPQQANDPR